MANELDITTEAKIPAILVKMHTFMGDEGTIALLKDEQGMFIRWRHPIFGSIIERMEYQQASLLREALNKMDPP